jgi:hypothetical protein
MAAAEPSPLPWRLDGPPMVVVADPGDGLVGGEAVEDGQGGAGAAEAAAAGDLDPFAAVRPPVGLAEGVEGVVAVGGTPKSGQRTRRWGQAGAGPPVRTRAKSAGLAGSTRRRPRTRAPLGRATRPFSSSQPMVVIL